MPQNSFGRILLAIVAGYLIDALFVAITELFYASVSIGVTARGITARLSYFEIDFITQCFYTVLGGYVCCAIARPLRQIAMIGLMVLGIAIGTISLLTSWRFEPHWYGIGLLAVYAPCVWIGWTLRRTHIAGRVRRGAEQTP